MKLALLTLSIFVSTFTWAAKPSSPTVIASLKIESENTVYKISNTQADKDSILERTSSKLSNKTIKIPKGLAADIKGELLSLQWRARYKSTRKSSSGCEKVASVDVEAEDTVKICQDQLAEASQIRNLQKHLNDLIDSKK